MTDAGRSQGDVIRRLARILLDLHRCEHGRLEGDPCLSCGGGSSGNPVIRPGSVIGYTRHGDEIVMPSWADHNEPESWIRRS